MSISKDTLSVYGIIKKKLKFCQKVLWILPLLTFCGDNCASCAFY